MSSKKKGDEPELDPYDVLGIEAGVPDAAITKAYRKLALKLHPDKQGSNLSQVEAERVAVQFQNIQQARAFLLDAEFREARTKYDAKRASIQRRRQADKERELNMNERRKRMREDLKRKEDEARKRTKTTSSSTTYSSKKHSQNDELLEKLRREGGNMRQAYAEKEQEAASETRRQKAQQEAKSRKEKVRMLEDRQIRLKWSRKKLNTSPSEDSIANMLSRFGAVEEVEMLGAKGNLALVTFADPSACRPCVEAFKNSEEMRASFVGKRKEEEELRQAAAAEEEEEIHNDPAAPKAVYSRDKETLYDRKLRQEAERQRLRREMEQEEEMGGKEQPKQQYEKGLSANSKEAASSNTVSVQFPSTESYKNLSPIEKLEKAESDILGKLLPPDMLARLNAVNA